jgi:5-methylcytosine-specific restriction endonuclease McrA
LLAHRQVIRFTQPSRCNDHPQNLSSEKMRKNGRIPQRFDNAEKLSVHSQGPRAQSPDRIHKRERNRRHDERRRNEQPWRRLYKTARWQALRAAQLAKQPLCERCLAKKPRRLTAATVAHHKIPHKGDEVLFFDPGNLASSCAPCHDETEQGIEARGYDLDVDPSTGLPTDPNHPFNR